jgi:methionine-S-sulfoxide reductase
MTSLFSRLFRPLSASATTSAAAFSVAAPRNNNSFTMPDNAQKATVAAGCFWGVEHLYRKHFANGKGLLDAKVGYAGGDAESPSYRQVCTGDTGRKLFFFFSFFSPLLFFSFPSVLYFLFFNEIAKCLLADAEALQITFDPSIVTYRQLLEFFYRMHDATTANRQGPDVGTQYRSAIFTHDDDQFQIAQEITDKVAKEWYKQPVSTQIVPAGKWWDAEEYHQLYLEHNPNGYECPSQ